jgi:hypothetical protein
MGEFRKGGQLGGSSEVLDSTVAAQNREINTYLL